MRPPAPIQPVHGPKKQTLYVLSCYLICDLVLSCVPLRDYSTLEEQIIKTHSYMICLCSDPFFRSPSITGTSVLAVKYNGGVAISADTLGKFITNAHLYLRYHNFTHLFSIINCKLIGSYGSLARFYVMERLKQVGDFTVVGGGGDYSDFQHTIKNLEELVYVSFII